MDFKNKNIEREYRYKINHIRSLIDAPVDNSKYLWNTISESYAKKIEQVDRVLSDDILLEDKDQDSESLRKELNDFLKRCSNPEFQIAIIGTIKAGKSTLINALLNYELASTRVTPETAALTKFKHADKDSLEIIFYNDSEWAQLWKSATSTINNVFIKEYNALNADAEKLRWLNHPPQVVECADKASLKSEIEHWTSSKFPFHYFVKEVVVGLKNFDLPDGVVLIDTPGLNDVVEFRSNITREYINRANAVFMCVKSDSLTGAELKTLYRVFANIGDKRNKVYVIATQLDALNNPIEDWQQQQVEWTKYLEGDNCYQNADLVRKNLVSVSAHFYTQLQNYRNNQLDGKAIRKLKNMASLKFDIDSDEFNAHFNELENLTNIKYLYSKMQNEVVAKYKTALLEDIAYKYMVCQQSIAKVIGKRKAEQQQIINDSQKSLDEIRRARDKIILELQAAQDDKRELNEFITGLKEMTARRVDEVVAAIRGNK